VRSLLIRFFLSFWLMIAITVGAAAVAGFYYAERAHAAVQRFEVSEAMYAASDALRRDGREGLTEWLASLPGVTGSFVYIIDERGRDLLERRLPAPVVIALRRFGGRPGPVPRDLGNLRPARPFTELVGSDGSVYTIFVLPPRGVVGNWLANRGLAGLVIFALVASALVSWFLAGTISRPVRQLRSTAKAIAEGRLDTRVSRTALNRRDEIGLLANDFDQMASALETSLHRQTELTRNVSHELRSPLARLRVALELARREAGDLPEFDKIESETEKLDELIGQILELSRLENAHEQPPSPVDLAATLLSVVDDLRFEHGDAVEITVGGIGDDVVVDGSKSALRACFENVLRNAAHHGRAGGKLEVTLKHEAGIASVTVQDDSGGVAPGDLAHLFEPFYRGSAGQSESRRQGSGLGLAIASRAVELHGGKIAAENRDNGLRVTVSLPTSR
jgi:two-component system sensor histidine kinase CpxA